MDGARGRPLPAWAADPSNATVRMIGKAEPFLGTAPAACSTSGDPSSPAAGVCVTILCPRNREGRLDGRRAGVTKCSRSSVYVNIRTPRKWAVTAAAIAPPRVTLRRRHGRGSWRGWVFVGPFMVVLFLVVQVPIMLGIALIVAMAIDGGRLYGKSFFRISIFLPYAVPAVVATLMWGFMYGSRFGLVGNIERAFGVSLPDLFSPGLVLASIANIVTWEYVGYNMLIFYSALRVIPTELYEAAEIDGAGQFRIIRSIKLPAIRGAVVVATVFSIIGSFQLFNEPSILQNLAPNAITTYFTPNLYAYSLSFSGQQYNYSATVAIVMGLITMAIAYAVQLRGMRREG